MPFVNQLHLEINYSSLLHLPETSSGYRTTDAERLTMLAAQGYTGVQGGDSSLIRAAGLRFTDGGSVRHPSEADAVARAALESKAEAVTLHVGTGFENDSEMDMLIRAILEAVQKHQVPLYIETHRATITQDAWRTVQAVQRFPEMRFNLDFSHWYTGLEWVYGDTNAKLEAILPVLDRVRYIHARIGNSGNIQVGLNTPDMERHIAVFEQVWTRAMQGFVATAKPNEVLSFVPELLHPSINYARVFPDATGEFVEESDRWLESWQLAELGKKCYKACNL